MNTFELALRIKGFPMLQARRRLAELQARDAAALADWNERARWAICRHHHERNPFYRRLVGSRLPDRWEDLPVLGKAQLQRPCTELLADGYSRSNTYIANTSGSDGQPFFFAKDMLCHALSWALVEQRYKVHGVNLCSKQARFYGIPRDRKGYLTERLKDWIANRRRFSVFDLSETALEGVTSVLRRMRFHYLYGYTSAICEYAYFLHDRGLSLREICPSLRACVVTSEVCSIEDRQLMRTAFDIPIVNEYGASEVGVLAIDHPAGDLLCSQETTYFETVADESGVERLLCTSLFNKAFPLIRYNLGDSVALVSRGGRMFVSQINGRTNDLVRLPSGRRAAGLTFYYIARQLLEESTPIRQFIVTQTQPDYFEFEVVASRPLRTAELSRIQWGLDEYLEPGLRFGVRYVDSVARQPNGKIRHFSSRMHLTEDETSLHRVSAATSQT